jgi:hypothetical protein
LIFELPRGRHHSFIFEAVALHGSSLLFNLGVGCSVFFLDVDYRPFVVVGACGIIFTLAFLWLYTVRVKRVTQFRAGAAAEPEASEK